MSRDRQVAVSVSVTIAEHDVEETAYALTRAVVQALPHASQGSLSIVVLDDEDEAQDEADDR